MHEWHGAAQAAQAADEEPHTASPAGTTAGDDGPALNTPVIVVTQAVSRDINPRAGTWVYITEIVRRAGLLRLVPAGLPRAGDTYLQIAYSRQTGLPVVWESYVGGKLTGRIRFAGRTDDAASSRGNADILEDATGRELVRWELADVPPVASEVPNLAEGWEGYVHLDRRAERPVLDAPLADALAALRSFDWTKAAEQLSYLPGDRARHPLVRLLQAWCLENDRSSDRRERVLVHLLDVPAVRSRKLLLPNWLRRIARPVAKRTPAEPPHEMPNPRRQLGATRAVYLLAGSQAVSSETRYHGPRT
jgi:hypothetical protein